MWKVYHKTVLVGGAWRTSNTRFPEYHVESVEKVFFVFLFSLSFSVLFFRNFRMFLLWFWNFKQIYEFRHLFLPFSGYFDFVIFNFKFQFRFKFLQQILQKQRFRLTWNSKEICDTPSDLFLLEVKRETNNKKQLKNKKRRRRRRRREEKGWQ